MTSSFILRGTGCVLAALLVSSIDARAAGGFWVSRNQEASITIGMTASEVEQRLGRPRHNVQYRSAPGPLWSYDVIDPLFGKTQFDIEFGADGRVLSASENVIGSNRPGG